jgi:cyclopropane-fatty-acyl-phospholipid synthase
VSPSGATREEIQSHYDRGDEFYRLWLGDERIYSCASWEDGVGTLEQAQALKIRRHLENLQLAPHAVLLDVGCGWGALLWSARRHFAAAVAVGLTLSETQRNAVNALGDPGIEARLESWSEHRPERAYDGIVSIGAFEHFARPEHTPAQRASIYSDFFRRCRAWLRPGGRLSLQTIAYGALAPAQPHPFMQSAIFQGSDLPKPQEVLTAAGPHLEVVAVRNDAGHYARTCETWLRNLQRRRREASALTDADTVTTYERYLRLSAMGFRTGRLVLLRLVLRSAARKA